MSSIVIPYTFVAGTTIVSAQVNANFSVIASVVNGNLDNSNLSAGANISLSKLNLTQTLLDLQSTGTNLAVGAGETGDTVERVGMLGNGNLVWGPGTATSIDVGLSRSAANTVQWNNGTLATGPVFVDYKYGTALNTTFGLVPGGRLYLGTGAPYTDGNASGSLLYGPAANNAIVLYNATTASYQPITFSETSLTLSALSTNTMYDVYATYASSTSLTLSAVGWSGINTPPTRGTDAYGRPTQNGSTAALLLGVFYNNGSKQTVDNTSERFIGNVYNAIPKSLFAADTTSSWSYSTSTVRAANANTTDGQGRVSFVSWLPSVPIQATCYCYLAAASSVASIGIGLNSTSTYSACAGENSGTIAATFTCSYAGTAGVGFNYLQRLEYGTATFNYSTSAIVTAGNALTSQVVN